MNIIQTTSFQLAVYQLGDIKADKLALVLPGRLDTKDYVHMRSHVDFLAERGYLALSFDPPGTWESPGGIELYTTTNYLKAIDELIERFGSKPTLLVGHSRGGSNAMLAGIANPHVTHFVAIMSTAGPTRVGLPNTGETIKMSYRDLPPGTSRTEDQKAFALPATYFEDQAQYDATEALKVCAKPKLFFYGSEDTLVSKASVMKLHEIASESKMIHELPTEHDYRLHPEMVEEVNQVMAKFLEKYKDDLVEI